MATPSNLLIAQLALPELEAQERSAAAVLASGLLASLVAALLLRRRARAA